MKTLVIISALASIATAVPAFLGENFELTQEKSLDPLKREKKSSTFSPDHLMRRDVNVVPVLHNDPNSDFDDAPVMGRSHGFKKPIIIKKKFGYHLFRDSDEEQETSDPQENCTKQVKVKLCDEKDSAKSNSMLKSSLENTEKSHMTVNEMEHSIKMAKEAVEHLQRDLKEKDQISSAKIAQWKHAKSESDAELHQNIEMARQALEHIHKNMGSLDSMHLHATTLKNAETSQNIPVKMPITEEERLAQWKVAIENIRKNVELVRNMEHNFRFDQATDNVDTKKNKKGKEFVKQVLDTFLPEFKKRSESSSEETNKEIMDNKSTTEMSHKQETEKKPSAAEALGSKSEVQEENEKERKSYVNEKDRLHSNNLHLTTKPNEVSSDGHAKGNMEHVVNKEVQQTYVSNPKSSSDTVSSATQGNGVENNKLMLVKTTTEERTTKKDLDAELTKQTTTTETHSENLGNNGSKQEENTNDMDIENLMWQDKNKLTKFNARFGDVTNNKENNQANFEISAKPIDKDHHFLSFHNNHEKAAELEESVVMKAADHIDDLQHQIFEPSNLDWSQKHINFDTTADFKAAQQNVNEFLDMKHERNMHIVPSHFVDLSFRNTPSENHFDTTSRDSSVLSSNIHENVMVNGKSTNVDTNNKQNHMNMRDAVDKSNLEQNNLMGWNEFHGSGRGAYAHSLYGGHGDSGVSGINIGAEGGAGVGVGSSTGGFNVGHVTAGGGPGAVGVFPHANVGGCAIPLLLSCSPTVVSGSLAKTHHSTGIASSTYSGPAYRAEEDFNSHNKRETKKSTDMSISKTKWTPTNMKKISITLDAKDKTMK